VGNPRKTVDGKADFRIMSVPATVFNQVVDIMTGGSEESFAHGNIGDHVEGYDLKLGRPQKNAQGDRWKVTVGPKPTPLYSDAQKVAFAGWPGMLVNLDEMLTKETKTPLDLFKAFYGRDPEPDEMSEGMKAVEEVEEVAKKEAEPEATNPGPDMDDEFMPKPAADQSKPAAPVPPKASRAVAPRTGGRR
jgi:hypothetical protein